MTAAHLRGTQFVGKAGGALLVLGLFLPWYATDASNGQSEIDGRTGGLAGRAVHPVLRRLLLGAASAPFGLARIILRDRCLSWALGEMTVVTSVAAFGLIADDGSIVDRPGDDIAIAPRPGFFAALAATIAPVGAAATRAADTERPRRPATI